MTAYAHIACCLDDSAAALRALAEARRLRALEPGVLSLVHVIAPPNLVVSVASQLGGGVPHDVGLEREAAAMWLSEQAIENPPSEPVLLEGSPARTACEWAAEADCDLIVAASHGGAAARARLGGFASHLAHHAPCPVLLVPPAPDDA